MRHTKQTAFCAGKALAIGAAAAAIITPAAFADTESDPKARDRKPAVIHPIVRYKQLPSGQIPPEGNFPSQNVDLLTWIPLNNFPLWPGNGSGADCWGYVSPSGREYALMGLSWGNGIVEVTNPANPVIRPTIPGSVNVLWRDITVVGNRAYAVSDSSGVGIQVLDLSNIDAGTVTLIGNISQGGHTTTHTLLSNTDSGFLYACGGNATSNGGCQPVSTSNPNNPTFAGPGWTTQYAHEAQIVTYTTGPYAGKEIAFIFAGGPFYGTTEGLAVVDITNKNNPLQMSLIAYPGIEFCHQGWLSPDRKYLYINDELDGPSSGSGSVPRFLTRIFDVTNLSNPRLTATYSNGLPSVDHNEYAIGDYLYQSNYTTGFRLCDVRDPLRPVEVAWIDTRPEDNGTGYNGCWGSYAFFPSGTVLASDLERGLFIFNVSILKLSLPGAAPTQLNPGQPTPLTVNVTERDATVDPSSVRLHVSVNAGSYTPIVMASQGGGAYAGNIPAGACLDRVQYYFSAQTTDVPPRSFTWPLAGAAEAFKATVRDSETTLFSDNFQNDMGWTVSNTTVAAGAWVRAVPAANGGQGAAIGDADGSGMAYVTGNGANEDLDGGPTRLLSPVFNLATSPEAVITYSRWLLSIQGTTDPLIVEVSNNNGTTWTQVESLGPSSGGWQKKSFRVADLVAPTAQVRLRFSITDTGTPASQTEAGVDAVSVTVPVCDAPCYPDCNNSGTLTIADFTCFQAEFVAGNPYADCNNSGSLTIADFTCFQAEFVAGCP